MTSFSIDQSLRIGTVFEVAGTSVKIALNEKFSELVLTNKGTVYQIGRIGSIVKMHLGSTILIAMINRVRLQSRNDDNTSFGSSSHIIEAELIGEGQIQRFDNKLRFKRGVYNYPLPLQGVYLVTQSESSQIYSNNAINFNTVSHVSIGTYSNSNNTPCIVDMNILFGHHFAVLGSTGTGKSTAVSGIINSMFDQNILSLSGKYHTELNTKTSDSEARSTNVDKVICPRTIIIDPNGEYSNAFNNATKFSALKENCSDSSINQLKFPYWLLTVDEFIHLLGIKSNFEKKVIRKATIHARMHKAKLVVSAKSKTRLSNINVHPEQPISIKGVNPAKITRFNSDLPLPFDLNEFEDHIRHCQNKVFENGKWINISELKFQNYFSNIFDVVNMVKYGGKYSLLMNDINYDLSDVFAQFLGDDGNKQFSKICIIDVSDFSTDTTILFTAILTRILHLYKYTQSRENREKNPILLVFEDAHRYIQHENNSELSFFVNSFQKIATEGKKYGIGLVLISQKPSSLDSTVLSHCNTWLIFRLTNTQDQDTVMKMLPDSIPGLVQFLPSLPSQEALLIGEAVTIPSKVNVSTVSKEKIPSSEDVKLSHGANHESQWTGDLLDIVQKMTNIDV